MNYIEAVISLLPLLLIVAGIMVLIVVGADL